MVKNCPKCGKEFPDNINFCADCGVKIEIPQEPVIPAAPVPTQPVAQPQQTPTQTQPVVQQPAPFKPPKKSNKKLFAIIGIIIIAVVIVALLFLFVLKGDNLTTSNTAEEDILGAWRMTSHTQLGSDPETCNQNWEFKSDGTIEFEPPVTDGFEEYYISNNEVCFTGYYYPNPRCYEFTFGSSKNSLTLDNDVVIITFTRIV